MTRPFLDSNVILYAAISDDSRAATAVSILRGGGRISVQAIAEFTAVVRRKLGMSWPEVEQSVRSLLDLCPNPVPIDIAICSDARRIAERYRYHIYDSQMIAAALAAGSRELLSEDMQHGQVIDGRLTIRNPFR